MTTRWQTARTLIVLSMVAAGVLLGAGSPAGAAGAAEAGILVECTIAAKAPYVSGGRVVGEATVGCPGVVTNLGVTVTLTRDGALPTSANKSCRALTCTVTTSAANPAGNQRWCVSAKRTSPHTATAPPVCRAL
ncbi:hypothetical protein AB0M43_11065 [Longispora sp. NPDC051575]|uniref:hypothetical protein n=1 Tax=Longispora sp. NPDC051575 TaxID=3154943 RepID=UPI00344A7C97